jgi:hypothetical protein
VAEGNGSEFERGRAKGETDTILADHTGQLAKIDLFMGKVVERLDSLVMLQQRMADSMDADRATVKTTAAALEAAERARREKGDQRWSPLTRLGVGVGSVAGLATTAGILYGLLHG